MLFNASKGMKVWYTEIKGENVLVGYLGQSKLENVAGIAISVQLYWQTVLNVDAI